MLQDGGTPFLVACQCNHIEAAKHLLIRGADVNSRMADGASAVFLVSQNGHDNILQFLLKSGANAHALRNVSRFASVSVNVVGCLYHLPFLSIRPDNHHAAVYCRKMCVHYYTTRKKRWTLF